MPEGLTLNLVNKGTGEVISHKAAIAGSFFSRLVGLMFRKSIDTESALAFYRTISIHTFFMRFPIDVLFLDKESRILKIYKALKPWRLAFCPKAFIVIELPADKSLEKKLKTGDILELKPV